MRGSLCFLGCISEVEIRDLKDHDAPRFLHVKQMIKLFLSLLCGSCLEYFEGDSDVKDFCSQLNPCNLDK